MSNDKIREEFEKWHKGRIRMLIAAGEPIAAKHCENLKAAYQSAWEASRAAIELELPFLPDPYDPDAAWANEGFKRIVSEAGLKVKS
jgi:hypothetical protein